MKKTKTTTTTSLALIPADQQQTRGRPDWKSHAKTVLSIFFFFFLCSFCFLFKFNASTQDTVFGFLGGRGLEAPPPTSRTLPLILPRAQFEALPAASGRETRRSKNTEHRPPLASQPQRPLQRRNYNHSHMTSRRVGVSQSVSQSEGRPPPPGGGRGEVSGGATDPTAHFIYYSYVIVYNLLITLMMASHVMKYLVLSFFFFPLPVFSLFYFFTLDDGMKWNNVTHRV